MLTVADRKKLHDRAGGRCSICFEPAAKVQLEEAHMWPRRPGGPRGGRAVPKGEREVYANYILLCSNCHSEVDSNPDDWPVERLQQIKRDHKARVAALGEKLNVLDGAVSVNVDEADDVAGVRINRPTRIQPGFRSDVTVKQGRRVTGIEIGGPDESDER